MMRTGSGFCAAALVFSAVSAISAGVFAQDGAPPPQDPPPAQPAPAVARAEAGGSVGGETRASGAMTLPERDPPRARAYAGNTDHDAVVGTLAIGYLGRRSMLVGDSQSGTGTSEVNAPIIGIRYWLDPMIGIDAGIGIGVFSNGLSNEPGGDAPAPSRNAFMLHGGVPLALATSEHFTFEVIPELNFGFSNYKLEGVAPAQGFSGSGFHFDIGARAGAEIHFGFIGLPKLSLQGTIGLAFASDSTKLENKDAGTTAKASLTSFGTSVQDSPWNIFTSNVAALYYF